MKRFTVSMVGLMFLIAASAAAQPAAPPPAKGSAPAAVRQDVQETKGKPEAKKTKMTKKTKREAGGGETGVKPVIK